MKGINKYLKIADLLQDFFENLNYCKNYCLKPNGKKSFGCCGKNLCTNQLYDWEIELKQLRDEKVNTETYLTDKGCSAGIIKPVCCIVYGCKDLIEYTKETYNIDYNLNKILLDAGLVYNETGNENFNILKNELEDMISTIRKKK